MDRNSLRVWVLARWMLTRGCALAITWLTLCALANIQFARAADDGTLPDALISTFAGFMAGQIAWVAIWSVLAPWPLSQRAAFCAIATFGILVSATAPLWMQSRVAEWRDFVEVAAMVPLPTLAVQSPLWVARTWLGWRIVQPMSDRPSGNLRAVSIRDFLLATACCAAALGVIRIYTSWRSPMNHDEAIASFAFSCGTLAFVSLLFALPAVASILRTHRSDMAVILVTGVQFTILGLPVGAMCLFSRVPPQAVAEITKVVVSAFVTLDLSLFLARGAGYRLQWRKRAV